MTLLTAKRYKTSNLLCLKLTACLQSLLRYSTIPHLNVMQLWSCRPFRNDQTLEEYVESNRDALDLFMKLSKGLHLEGFLYEVHFPSFFNSVGLWR